MTVTSPYLTDREKRLHAADCGRHAAQAQAILRLGLILETDEDSPAPMFMTHSAEDGKVYDTLWGAILPSVPEDTAVAALDAWAARHHVCAGWRDGRYEAVMHLGGSYRYGVKYTPARVLYPPQVAPAAEAQPELAVA